jgi:hypothetical protein
LVAHLLWEQRVAGSNPVTPTHKISFMKILSNVDWIWESGKVFSILTFSNGSKETRINDKPPPTWACHDIAHFICGFHENLEWDYQLDQNHIAEYNAVFVEHLLTEFSFHYFHNLPMNIHSISERIFDYMKWFSEDYYKIKDNHPSKRNSLELQEYFFNNLDLNILSTHFTSFYKTWIIQNMLQTENFNINIKMSDKEKNKIEEVKSYSLRIKKIIQSFS